MGALLFCHFQNANVKLINEKISLIIAISKSHGLPDSITFFVFSLLCCKYICDICICLSMLDFNGLCKFSSIFISKITRAGLYNYNGRQNRIFSFEMWIDLILDRLTGPGNVFVKCLRLMLAYRRSYKFNNNLRTLK